MLEKGRLPEQASDFLNSSAHLKLTFLMFRYPGQLAGSLLGPIVHGVVVSIRPRERR